MKPKIFKFIKIIIISIISIVVILLITNLFFKNSSLERKLLKNNFTVISTDQYELVKSGSSLEDYLTSTATEKENNSLIIDLKAKTITKNENVTSLKKETEKTTNFNLEKNIVTTYFSETSDNSLKYLNVTYDLANDAFSCEENGDFSCNQLQDYTLDTLDEIFTLFEKLKISPTDIINS